MPISVLLSLVAAPAVSPDANWALLTDPRTPYAQRMAAAKRWAPSFPLSDLSRLIAARETLRNEEALHKWGFLPDPGQQVAYLGPTKALTPDQRRRTILGHAWILPAIPTHRPAPETAPWPWAAKQALDALYDSIVPEGRLHSLADRAYIDRWYAEAMRMPLRSDREAARFVEATEAPGHFKSLPVLARWRRIALDATKPEAAALVAGNVGEAMTLWDDPRAQDLGQAILSDILAKSKNAEVRAQAAHSTVYLKEGLRFTHPRGESDLRRLPTPYLAIAALGDAAVDPRTGPEWNRLYLFASPACALLPDSPVKSDINGMTPDSPEAKRALRAFAAWFRAHRAEMLARGKRQIRATQAVAAVRAGA